MSTRLDRLFVLLETGGSGVTREAAAQQLGEVVKLHPQELHPLLSRLHTYLTSTSWETRIAAGSAVKAIITNVPQWNPQPQINQDGEECSSKLGPGRLSVQSFDVIQVLQKGSYLMAADEKQFEIDEETSNMEPQARMAFQRQLVNQRLGLDVAEAIGISTEGIVSNSDLQDCGVQRNLSGSRKDTVVNIVKCEMNSAGMLSSRELNKARRHAKILAKQISREPAESNMDEGGPESKRQKLNSNSNIGDAPDSDDEGKMVVDEGPTSHGEDEGGDWPLDTFCSRLCTELFSPAWETRHGSATALREIITVHGNGAGKSKTQTAEEMSWCHQAWLEDMAVRLICVLALDRFGDFVSDQVVAPVRETCAQALGAVFQVLSVSGVWGVVRLLETMLSWREWEARHGGLLGLKYLLAVRTDIRDELLKHAYPHIYKGLQDEMDDVVAVAAACLVPVADAVITLLDKDIVTGLVATLWDALLDIDDLTASTSSILQLLAKILAHPGTCIRVRGNLEELVPRLWPFLYHSNSAVRKSALTTLATLTSPKELILDKNIDNGLPKQENCLTESNSINYSTEKLASIKKEDIKLEQDNAIIKTENVNDILKTESDKSDCTNNNNDIKSEDDIKKEVLQRSKSVEGCEWLFPIIKPALTHLFQRSLLETSTQNLELIFLIWEQMLECISLEGILPAVCPLMPSWLYLIMGNPQLPLDPALLLKAHHHKQQNKPLPGAAAVSGCHLNQGNVPPESQFYLGGCELINKPVEKQEVVIRARCAGAKLLGRLSNYIVQPMPGIEYSEQDTPILCYIRLLVNHLSSRSAVQRLAIGAVVREWALAYPQITLHPLLRETLLNCLTEVVYYDEIAMSFSRLQQDSRDFIAMLRHYKLDLPESFTNAPVLTLEQIQTLSGRVALTLFNSAKLRPKVQVTLEERRKAIQSSVSQTSSDQVNLATMTQAIIAGALIRFSVLPEKLNPVIKPIMDSIKKEQNLQLQSLAADDLTKLLELCINRQPSPNNKVVKNLATFMCVDTEFTPPIAVQIDKQIDKSVSPPDKYKGILSLSWHQKNEEKKSLRRSTSVTGRGPGRPPGRPPANLKPEDPEKMTQSIIESENQQIYEIQRRGCTTALVNISKYFDKDLPSKIPYLWDMICKPFSSIRPLETQISREGDELPSEDTLAQETVNWLQLMEVMVPALHPSLVAELEGRLATMEQWLYNSYSAVRHMAARVLGVLSRALTVVTVSWIVVAVLPLLEEMDNSLRRQGAVEAVYQVINKLGLEIVPYIVLLIVPLLGGMSDPDHSVRLLSTQCFANLIRLLPLEGGVPTPPSLSEELTERKMREREFLQQLMNPKEIKSYEVPVPINAQLRSYQQNGINWLYFLQQYRLHGILCDDMGLGKTLQSICILAGSQYTKEQEREKKGDPSLPIVQSLVICPPTLTGHWVYEIEKFVSKRYLNPLHYTGPPVERYKLRRYVPEHNLIVASYDIVRNDIDFFSQITWNYVILDEGHIIKNGKTKSSRAIKQLTALHRVILSGTPIQNNVLELWSLFDFLMPCFLGTERQFMSRYSKPILASRDAKSSSAEQEAGVLAMESLHRQVLPFLLRRQKEDVLSDLPPKITQDYYCELSPLQAQLYEDFARSQARQSIDDSFTGAKDHTEAGSSSSPTKPHSHIFQALQYLRKVCNHPKLVVKPQHPEYPRIVAHLQTQNSSLSDISHSAKLPALKQLLLDCGIGVASGATATENVVSQHRALVFCQLKSMLDIIENDLLRAHLPGVSYLRLDGSVAAGSRHALVQRFNADPSIDLLLLTTQVGGLGLNLTGADTVIFVEHDWNPMRDLQAMDRAHRIGQKRVVNVYRLITRGTLEEKIMGLQKFKLLTANTVISQDNASLLSMGTDQLLDLFNLNSTIGSTAQKNGGESSGGKRGTSTQGLGVSGASAVLEGLPELWDQDQYDTEYNLDTWLHNLSK